MRYAPHFGLLAEFNRYFPASGAELGAGNSSEELQSLLRVSDFSKRPLFGH